MAISKGEWGDYETSNPIAQLNGLAAMIANHLTKQSAGQLLLLARRAECWSHPHRGPGTIHRSGSLTTAELTRCSASLPTWWTRMCPSQKVRLRAGDSSLNSMATCEATCREGIGRRLRRRPFGTELVPLSPTQGHNRHRFLRVELHNRFANEGGSTRAICRHCPDGECQPWRTSENLRAKTGSP